MNDVWRMKELADKYGVAQPMLGEFMQPFIMSLLEAMDKANVEMVNGLTASRYPRGLFGAQAGTGQQ